MSLTVFTLIAALALGGDTVEAIRKDKMALQGVWKVTSSISKGETSTPDEIKDLALIFRADGISVREGGQTHDNFNYLLDPTRKIKEIDLILKAGPQKGRIDRGIYRLDGSTLTICIQSDKDAPRPREFHSPPGSQLWLVVLQRTKE